MFVTKKGMFASQFLQRKSATMRRVFVAKQRKLVSSEEMTHKSENATNVNFHFSQAQTNFEFCGSSEFEKEPSVALTQGITT